MVQLKYPDVSVNKAVLVLIDQMKKLKDTELKRMVKLSMDYNPATKALLGTILELCFPDVQITGLLKSLNPLSKYKLDLSDSLFSNKFKWNIK